MVNACVCVSMSLHVCLYNLLFLSVSSCESLCKLSSVCSLCASVCKGVFVCLFTCHNDKDINFPSLSSDCRLQPSLYNWQ